MRRKRRYKNHQDKREDRSPIIGLFTWIIVLWFFWVSTILLVLWITICIFAWIHILNDRLWWYRKKKYISVLTYMIGIFITVWWIYLIIENRESINQKFKEISDWFASYISIWQNKKGSLELQPNEQWILLKTLNNMFQSTWQVQQGQNDG